MPRSSRRRRLISLVTASTPGSASGRQPGFDLFGLEAGPARDGEGPAFQVDGDEAAPVALGQEEPALFQRVPEARQIIGRSPGLLEGLLDLARVEAELFGLLPFFQGEVERAFPAIGAVAWGQLPAVFEIELSREVAQPLLEEGQVDRFQLLAVDPAPNGMGMATAFLLVDDDDARLAGQPDRCLGAVNRCQELIDRDLGVPGRR